MKTCGKCGESKPLDQFAWRNKAKQTKNVWCKSCSKDYDRNRYLTTNRPSEAKANNQLSRKRNVEWIDNYLLGKSCVDCGCSDRRVFHLDHRNPEEKIDNVSRLVYRGVSLETLEAEVLKCDVRCSNCHLIRTGVQFAWRTAIIGV